MPLPASLFDTLLLACHGEREWQPLLELLGAAEESPAWRSGGAREQATSPRWLACPRHRPLHGAACEQAYLLAADALRALGGSRGGSNPRSRLLRDVARRRRKLRRSEEATARRGARAGLALGRRGAAAPCATAMGEEVEGSAAEAASAWRGWVLREAGGEESFCVGDGVGRGEAQAARLLRVYHSLAASGLGWAGGEEGGGDGGGPGRLVDDSAVCV